MVYENRRLKHIFAELSMQNDLLKKALGKKSWGCLNKRRWTKRLYIIMMSVLHWSVKLSKSVGYAFTMKEGSTMKMPRFLIG
jgi:hypothetical protein